MATAVDLHKPLTAADRVASVTRRRSSTPSRKFLKCLLASVKDEKKSQLTALREDGKEVTHTPVAHGKEGTHEWRLYLLKPNADGESTAVYSAWHEIPMKEDGMYNFVNEIPKGQRAKMEIATHEKLTPIKQDTKNGQLRYFKYGDIPFNYGCLPQTWEDPNATHPDTGCNGDNDPIDVVEIGAEPIGIGAVTPVKVLGVLGMIDDGETDWKIIALRNSHAKAELVNDIEDVETHFPNLLHTVREWFRNYKTPDGKPQNRFSHDEEYQNRAYAETVIQETHEAWQLLMKGQSDGKGLNVTRTRVHVSHHDHDDDDDEEE